MACRMRGTVAVLLFLVGAVLVAGHQTARRRHHHASDVQAAEGEFLVNGNANAHPKTGYGASAGMGDWLSSNKKRHHSQAQEAAAPEAAAEANARFASSKPSSGADALLPIRRRANAYSAPAEKNTLPELTAANTPIATALPKEPTPLLESEPAPVAPAHAESHAAHRFASPHGASIVRGAAAAAKSAGAGSFEQKLARGDAYEMPTMFAGTLMAKGKRDDAVHDPDLFFHMNKLPEKAEKLSKLGKPLYDNGSPTQYDTLEKWESDLSSRGKVNLLHKKLLAKIHNKPLPPPKPHHPSALRTLRFKQQQKRAAIAAEIESAQAATAKAEAERAAAEAEIASIHASTEAIPSAPVSPFDADAQEFVSFARALGEPIDPVAHRARIARAAQLVLDDRLSHDARFMAVKAKAEAEALRKRRAKAAAKTRKARKLAAELAAVKRERKELAIEKKRIAKQKRELANAAKLKAAALVRARAKAKAAKAAKAKAEKAKAAAALPAHLFAGAVPLPHEIPLASAKPTAAAAAAVAANPFLQYANPPAAAAAPVTAPAVVAAPAAPPAATVKPVVAAAAVPVAPQPVAAQQPIVVAAPAAAAVPVRPVAPPAPAPVVPASSSSVYVAAPAPPPISTYVGDQPVIMATDNIQPTIAAARDELPPPIAVSSGADATYDRSAPADNNNDPSALAIPASAMAEVGSTQLNPVYENGDTGITTYGSADDLSLVQTKSEKWKGNERPTREAIASGANTANSVNPILKCILANCSVPYFTCLSSLSCSAVFDCLQTSDAPVQSCAAVHAKMTPRDKRVFAELAECEQRESCFASENEPITDAHTQPAASPAPVPTPAPAPAKPVAPKPNSPVNCAESCRAKCAGSTDRKCRHQCNIDCFAKRYVVQL